MAKKKTKKSKFAFRNAVPRAPRAAKAGGETATQRLVYTLAGAAGASLAGGFLKREGWIPPKTFATALTAVGAGLAWKGDASPIRSVGAGVMGASGGQLALMMIDKSAAKTDTKTVPPAIATAQPKLKNADQVPDAAILAALERARTRLALESRETA
ncbi:MAG: hypothetical protein QM831_44015 [Kofleriaceae bacterium]